jgi:hypothetical protein
LNRPTVLCCADVGEPLLRRIAGSYDVSVEWLAAGATVSGSFWGEPEAGIVGRRIYVRPDTPVHSFLHELCHIVCVSLERREQLDGDAGSDDLEESAVCYLQLVLAEQLPGVGRQRLMQDMDAWGYSFRLGATQRWFEDDADDARAWLVGEGLLQADGEPVFRLRGC